MILDLITEAQAGGLTLERACEVFDLAPRTIQRWRTPCSLAPTAADDRWPAQATPVEVRPRPYNALTVSELSAKTRKPPTLPGSTSRVFVTPR